MKKELFRGVGTALVTPFDENGKVSVSRLQELIRFQLDKNADALILCGTTGESAVLSDAEKEEIFCQGITLCHGKIPVIAGVGSNDTQKTIRMAKIAEKCGADGLLIVTPYYNKTTPQGAYQHYKAITESVALPIILYNVPSRTGFDLPVDIIHRLALLPGIIGIKEACGSMEKISRIMAVCPSDFSVYAGNDAETLPVLAFGGSGVISVASNLLPNVVHSMCTAFWSNDTESARNLQQLLTPLETLLFSCVNPIPVKALMELIGFPSGQCRLPLEQLNESQREELLRQGRKILAQFAPV